MEAMVLNQKHLDDYQSFLLEEEKSKATISKYLRDIHSFVDYLEGRPVNKELMLAYKEELQQKYSSVSINSMLVALNRFFTFLGRTDWKIKLLKTQRKMFCSDDMELTKQEYISLLNVSKDQRINFVMKTICATGIRVSELQFITVEAVRRGKAEVYCKNKLRTILIPAKLCKELNRYVKKNKITGGPVFVTNTGRALNRSNIWKDMKKLCQDAGVDHKKVFPHNLRHLFARTYYHLEKDIAKLADLLGHSSIETTRIYIITSGKEHQKQLSEMKLVV